MTSRNVVGQILLTMTLLGHASFVLGWKPLYPAARTGGAYMHNYYIPPAGSATPWWPAWSPDGEEIAFSMQGSIWKIRADGDTAYQLTANPTYDSSPDFSPDGRWLVYTADQNTENINLMLLNLETRESAALTRGDHVNLDPVWSPDGGRIAYVSTAPNGYYNLFALPIKDGNAAAPIQLTLDHGYGKNRLYFQEIDLHIEPTWSPDGRELILLSNREIPLGSGALWRVPVGQNDSDIMTRARIIHQEQTLYRTRPHWSPDGKRIVYSSHAGGEFSHLFVLPVDGGQPYKLTFGNWDHFHPRWSPDGHRIAYISNHGGLPHLHILQTFGGEDRCVKIRRRIHRRPMGWLQVRVQDEESGESTAARVYLKASDGKTYGPDDAYHRIDREAQHLFHTNGTFTVQVPAGRLELEVMKGFERLPVKKEIQITAGRFALETVTLSRMTNLKARGWYSGSMHIHMNYGGNLRNTPEHMMLMGDAEDTDVIGVQVANKDNRILDYHHFRGEVDPISTPERILMFGQEYRPPYYGHISFFNLQKHLISPFTTGYEGTGLESLYPSNTDMFRLARAQGAIGGYVHPGGGPRGFLVDAALGTIDYHEVMSGGNHKRVAEVWHRALNCGFKIPAEGGEDSNTSLHIMKIMGSGRTYTYLGEGLSWEGWVKGLKEGRTFVTNGPLLDFTIDGRMPGEEIRLPAGGATIVLRARMDSIVPIESVEVFHNGKVIETIPVLDGGHRAESEKRIRVSRSGWYTLRASTDEYTHPTDSVYPFAETSPLYVYVGEQPIRSAPDAEYFIGRIDEVVEELRRYPSWRSDQEREHVLSQYSEARRIYEERVREARSGFLD
ncbi:MAG: CehA/McbA family metallohydrolase [Acidobacteriota bacterium]